MERTQIGWPFMIIIPIIILIVVFTVPADESQITLVVLSIILLLFYKMTISVDNQKVKFKFGIGIIRGKYLFSDIESVRALEYVPWGWGIRIRFAAKAFLFNVSGKKAVELKLKDKKWKVWLGTDSPDEVADFINRKIAS